MSAPVWATRLVERVCADAGVPVPPTFTWRRGSDSYSTGTTWTARPGHPGRIVVTAGRDARDRRMVLLHELAHWIVGVEHHHDAVFWRTTFDLYAAHGLVRYATRRESSFVGAQREARRRRARPGGVTPAVV